MKATERTKLGCTPVEVTRLGLGTTAIGNMYQEIPVDQALDTVRFAFDQGIRYFDTAPQYGRGIAEVRLGAALSSLPRTELTLASKVGRLLRADAPENPDDFYEGEPYDKGTPIGNTVYDYSRDGVLKSIEESLVRLGQDHLDIVYVHDPDDYVDEALATAFPTLIELREQGVIKAIGAGMNQVKALTRFARESDPDVFLLAGRYTLLEQTALDELLPLCEQRGIAVVIGGAFNSGLLADPNPGTHYNYMPAPEELIERARLLRQVCDSHSVPLKAAALQLPLGHPAVACVLTGAKSRSELAENIAHFEHPIPSELWDDLKSKGLLGKAVPVPS